MTLNLEEKSILIAALESLQSDIEWNLQTWRDMGEADRVRGLEQFAESVRKAEAKIKGRKEKSDDPRQEEMAFAALATLANNSACAVGSSG